MGLFRKSDLSNVIINKGNNYSFNESAKNILLNEATTFSTSKTYDIFLSHSYSDATEILKVKRLIEGMGYTTYVDWVEDRQLDRSKVSKKTAETLRIRMNQCKSLFFITSDNSSNSIWMPWELGYFDANKGKVAILPIISQSQETNNYVGQEYLGLYCYVTKDRINNSHKEALWIHESPQKYVIFEHWLEGKEPTTH